MFRKKSFSKRPQNQGPPSFQRLLEYSLWLLGRRNYHSAELKIKLKKKAATQEQIKQVIQKLQSFKYLNDKTYITSYLTSELLRKPQGLYLLKQRLLQRRIPREEVESALENFPYSEEEQIKKALHKKMAISASNQFQSVSKTSFGQALEEKFQSDTQSTSEIFSNKELAQKETSFAANQNQFTQTKTLPKEKLFRFLQARGFSVEGILKALS